MKVAVVMQNLSGGGAERMFINLMREWVASSVEIDLVLFERSGEYLDNLPAGVNVIELGASRVAAGVGKLSRYLKDAAPDAVFSGLPHINAVTVLAHLLSRSKSRLIISERNATKSEMRRGHISTRAAYLLNFLLYRVPPRIIAVSNGVRDELAEALFLPRSRIVAIKNPVVTPQIASLRDAAVDGQLPDADGAEIVLGAGRLVQQKGFDVLIEAFATVAKTRRAVLWLMGDGPLKAELQERATALGIADKVSFLGFQKNPYAIMARADVFVLSSYWEGSPNVLVEAMACGAAVVSTDCPHGPREILDGGRIGPLVRPGDAAGLADAITATLAGRGATQGERLAVAQTYDSRVVAAQYLEVLSGANP